MIDNQKLNELLSDLETDSKIQQDYYFNKEVQRK